MVRRVPIILDSEIQVAIYGKCHDEKISEIYAVQQCIVRQMYQEKRISREVYESRLCRYQKTITKEEPPKRLTAQEQAAQQKTDELTRHFERVIHEWDGYKDDLVWVERTVNFARKYSGQIAAAQHVVERGEQILANRITVLGEMKVGTTREKTV